jgi:hypothetical protein
MLGIRYQNQNNEIRSEFETVTLDNVEFKKYLNKGTYGSVSTYAFKSPIHHSNTIIAVKRVLLDIDQKLTEKPIPLPLDVQNAIIFKNALPLGILDFYVAKDAHIVKGDKHFHTKIQWEDYVRESNGVYSLVFSQNDELVQEIIDWMGDVESVQCAFDIFMDSCRGSLVTLVTIDDYIFKRNKNMPIDILTSVCLQLSKIYNATKMMYTDMKFANVLYMMANGKYTFYIGDFGSFAKNGDEVFESYRIPFTDEYEPRPKHMIDIRAFPGFGLWSLYILFECCRNNFNASDDDEWLTTMESYDGMNTIFEKFKNKQYENPYCDAMIDFLETIAIPLLNIENHSDDDDDSNDGIVEDNNDGNDIDYDSADTQ